MDTKNTWAKNTWVVVLAGGDGTRLKTLTTDAEGVTVPKQFWSLHGGPSLLQLALERARRLVPPERICVVIGARHQPWWEQQQASLADANVIVEPSNRGTAIGVLRAVLTIMSRDIDARIVFLPADQYVAQEVVLADALRHAIVEGAAGGRRLVLLGIEPSEPDPQLDYIIPGWPVHEGLFTVRRFIEKPVRAVAVRLLAQGGLWNSFIWVADGGPLRNLIARKYPLIVAALSLAVLATRGAAPRCDEIRRLYDRLQSIDFSRDVLSDASECLLVRRVPTCGWSDLGTLPRVFAALRVTPQRAPGPLAGISTRSLLDAVTARESEWREEATHIEW